MYETEHGGVRVTQDQLDDAVADPKQPPILPEFPHVHEQTGMSLFGGEDPGEQRLGDAVAVRVGGHRHDVGERLGGGADPEVGGALRLRRDDDSDARLARGFGRFVEHGGGAAFRALAGGHDIARWNSLRQIARSNRLALADGPLPPAVLAGDKPCVGHERFSSHGLAVGGGAGGALHRQSGGDVDALAPGLAVPLRRRVGVVAEQNRKWRLGLGVAGALHVREIQAARGFDALGFEPCEAGPEVGPAPALRFELLGEVLARVLGDVRDSSVDLQDDDPLGLSSCAISRGTHRFV